MRIPRGPATVIGEAGRHLHSATRFTPGKAGGPSLTRKPGDLLGAEQMAASRKG